MKVEFTPVAEADLQEIALYIAIDDAEAAERWVDHLIAAAHRAAHAPRAGRVVPELGDSSIREFFVRSYRVIYRVEPSRILVLTIFEGHRLFRGFPSQ